MLITPRILKRTALAAGVGLLLNACAETPDYSGDLNMQLADLLDNLCPAPSPGVESDVSIKIKFVEENGNLCPKEVDLDCPAVYEGKKLTFTAVDSNWDPFPSDPPRFKVYFAPIQGKTLNATDGDVEATINDKVPAAVYKYTVWDWPQGNTDPVCKPLDPNFRVNQ